MGATRHEKSFVDFEKGYEQNIIGLKGIIYFGIGLVLLILITFGLMWALLNVMRDQAEAAAGPPNPMIMNDRERLPPEPRLQAAPGFGIDGPEGRKNLELLHPQAEYWELRDQWKDLVDNGRKDPKTGVVTALPIEEAKGLLLQQGLKTRTGGSAETLVHDSRAIVSDSSAGRDASWKGN